MRASTTVALWGVMLFTGVPVPAGAQAPPSSASAPPGPLVAPAPPQRLDGAAARPVSILVLPLDARQGVSGDTADFTTSLLVQRMRELPGFKVLAYRELEAMAALEVKKMLQGCDEVSCAAEMAGALNAEQVVVGSVGRLGSTMVLTLSRVRQRDASVMASWANQFEAPNDAVVGKQLPVAVKALFPELLGAPSIASGPASAPTQGTAVALQGPGGNAPAAAQAPLAANAADPDATPAEPGMRVLATVLKGGGGVVAGLASVAALGGVVTIGTGVVIIGLYLRGQFDLSADPVPVALVQGGALAAMVGLAVTAVSAVLLVLGVVAVAGGVVLD